MPRVRVLPAGRGPREADIGYAIALSRELGMYIRRPGSDCMYTVHQRGRPIFQCRTVPEVVAWLRAQSPGCTAALAALSVKSPSR